MSGTAERKRLSRLLWVLIESRLPGAPPELLESYLLLSHVANLILMGAEHAALEALKPVTSEHFMALGVPSAMAIDDLLRELESQLKGAG